MKKFRFFYYIFQGIDWIFPWGYYLIIFAIPYPSFCENNKQKFPFLQKKLIFFYRCKKIFLMGAIFKIDREKNIFDGKFSNVIEKKVFLMGNFQM